LDTKGKGNGYELSVLYQPEDHLVPSSNSIEETNGTIIIAPLTIICLLLPFSRGQSELDESLPDL